jgi:hydrogenase maturation factor HypF (carbamoyltransferase family)
MSEPRPILCNACNVEVKALVNPDSHADPIVVCPNCGVQDNLENAMREVADYLVNKSLRDTFSGINSPSMTVTRPPERHYRFIPG